MYQLIKANRARYPARILCETLGVSHSGYYDWAKRTPSRRTIANCRLIEQIMVIYRTSDGTYGLPALPFSALNMALITRKQGKVIHHSDQGSQYTSVEFGKHCKEMDVRSSMGSVGDA